MDKKPVYRETAYAKINLTLDVLGERPDGYHEVRMLMQTVSLRDTLSLTIQEGAAFGLTSTFPFLPLDSRNLVCKAAQIFCARTGRSTDGLRFHLEKHIPVGSGMAGGSADAAATLRLLNRTFEAELSEAALLEMAAQLGSDVPFCVRGGTQLSEGRGERLTPVSSLPACHIVLCKPSFSVSTATVFAALSGVRIPFHPDLDGALASLQNRDLRGLSQRLFNVLTDVLPQGKQSVQLIQKTLFETGALGAVMSGSGPTVFGVFDDLAQAKAAYGHLSPLFSETFLVEPIDALTFGFV